jgi:hypothetical protein
MNNKEDEFFFDRMKKHPRLKKRFDEILNITENTSGELITMDEAEMKAIEEVRKLGQEVMHEWINQHKKQIETFESQNKTRRYTKKTLLANNIWANRNRRNHYGSRRQNNTPFFLCSKDKVSFLFFLSAASNR